MEQEIEFHSDQNPRSGGISKVLVEGFKSIAYTCHVDIGYLTVLAGRNSSGKSSMMQPLLLMKQTLHAAADPGPLLLNGPNAQFTSLDQVFSKRSPKTQTDEMTFDVRLASSESLSILFEEYKKKLKVGYSVYSDRSQRLEGLTEDDLVESADIAKHVLENAKSVVGDLSNFEWRVLSQPNRFLHQIGLFSNAALKNNNERPRYTFTPGDAVAAQIRKIIHIPGSRQISARSVNATAINPEYPGIFDDYIASIIDGFQTTRDDRLESLDESLRSLGLTSRVETNRVGTQLEILVGRLDQWSKRSPKDLINIRDVGSGVSQILPLLVALSVAEPEQMIYLEEPEAHLHPQAVVKLAKIIADAANRNVRVVIETHSDLLLLGIQTLVAAGHISNEKIRLHWFDRDKDGFTKVSSANLDKAGAFSEWPVDFGDVRLDTQSKYLDAAEAVSGMK